jgi:hypothetical protein
VKIAIIGAPGSGKTDVAVALADKFPTGPTALVDGYVEELGNVTGFAYGHATGFTGNLQIAFERLRAEQYARQNDRIITCGTLIETVLYTRLYAEGRINAAPNEEIIRELNRANNTAALYGQLIWDTWRYDYVFINRLPEAKRDDSWTSILDSDLVPGLEAFFIEHQVLKSEASVDEKAKQAYNYIVRQESKREDASSDKR